VAGIKEIKLQRSHVIILVLISIIIAMIIFGYFYMMRVSPLETGSLPDNISDMPVQKFIIKGAEKDPLNKVLGVAVNHDNNQIVVADSGNHRIAVFDANGKVVKTFGKFGKGDSEFNYPTSVAVSPEGEIYVVDFNNRRIQIFDEEGKLLRKITEDTAGSPFIPVVVTVDEEGEVFVSDLGKQQILVFDRKDKVARSIAKAGTGEGQISYANGLYVDNKNGWLFVADSNNGRVQVFTLEGKFVKSLNRELGFAVPRGILYDTEAGRLYVVDTLLHQVKVFDGGFKPIGGFGGQGTGDGQLSFPNSMARDERGNLYIADRENNRIVVYGY